MTQLYIHSCAEYWGCFSVLPINTGVGCHSFPQGIFPTQGSNLRLRGFSSPVAAAEFSKFAAILSAALSQHHLLGFEIAQLEFHYLH